MARSPNRATDRQDGEPERINQVALRGAIELHEIFVDGHSGGKRLSINFKDACNLDLGGHRLAGAQLVGARLT
ncbi:MAG: hypothetical protein ACREDZ_06820, partial [Kiloniellales bacterium]